MQKYVLDRNGNVVATFASDYNDKHTKTLQAGASTYEFTISKQDEAALFLETGNYINFVDDVGKPWSFSILSYTETHNEKTVYCEDVGIELINKNVNAYKADAAYSFAFYFEMITKNTPWTIGINEISDLSRKLEWTSNDTGLSRLLSLLTEFDNAECKFNVKFAQNKPTEFKVDIYKQIGNPRTNVQIVYSNELNDITKTESRAEFVTAIQGEGGTPTKNADGTDIVTGTNPDGTTIETPKITFADIEYKDDNYVSAKGDNFLRAATANKLFNPNSQDTYIEGYYSYETQSPQELLNRTLTQLKKYSAPQYKYEADVQIIDKNLDLGDTVKIIDHDYKPGLYLEARVASLEKSYTDPSKNTVTFTNYRLVNSSLAQKLADLQNIINSMPTASGISSIVTNVINNSNVIEQKILALQSADGRSTVYYDAKPSNAKEGDTAFVKNPDSGNMEIWNFVNGEWTLTIGDATVADLKKLINDSQAETKKAVDDVNAKVNAANEELTKANAEIDKLGINHDELVKIVDGVKSDASTAGQNALDALATAKTDLTKNLNKEITDRANAVTALDTKAKGYADTAKADAISASTTADGAINKKIDDTASSITSTISQNKTDADGKITTAQSTATQALNGLATKVSQTAYDTKTGQLQTDLNTTTTTANQAKTDIVAIKKTNTDQDTRMTTIESDANGVKTTVSSLQTTANTQAGSISTLQQRADGFDATVATLGQINQLFNTEFSPDLQGWKTVRDPFVLSGSYNGSNQLLNTATTSGNRLYADLIYVKDVPVISFSVVNDSWVIVRGYGQDRKLLRELYSQLRTGYGLNKMENKAIPSDVYYVEFGFQSSAGGYVSQPMLTFSDKVGKYVQGNYNNNASVAKAQLTADNASLALSNYKTDADGRISKAQADIIVNANAITQKVSQSDYNAKTGDLTTKVNTAQSTADSATSTIGSYKTSNDGRVASAESKINQNTSAIELRVLKTDLSGAVNGLAKETYVDAQIKIKADEINSTVAKSITSATSGLATVTALTSVKQSADAWGVVAQQNKTDIANLTVTANGIKASVEDKATKTEVTTLAGQITSTISAVQGGGINLLTGTTADFVTVTGTSWAPRNLGDYSGLIVGNQYTASASIGNADQSVNLEIYAIKADGSRVTRVGFATISANSRNSVTFTWPDLASSGAVGVRFNSAWTNATDSGSYQVARAKLEKGTIATPWSAAPEDIQSQITQTQSMIDARVEKDGVVNAINISKENILINGNKVHITGQTTIDSGIITNAMIANAVIDSEKIKDSAVTNAKIANLDGGKIVANSITADKLAVNALLVGLDSAMGDNIEMAQGVISFNQSDGYKMKMDSSGLTFGKFAAPTDTVASLTIIPSVYGISGLHIQGDALITGNVYGRGTYHAGSAYGHFDNSLIFNGSEGIAFFNGAKAGIWIGNNNEVRVVRDGTSKQLI